MMEGTTEEPFYDASDRLLPITSTTTATKRVELRLGNDHQIHQFERIELEEGKIARTQNDSTCSSEKENEQPNHKPHSDHDQLDDEIDDDKVRPHTTPIASLTAMTTSTAADLEQHRSRSLLQKLRQSAFSRKMNANPSHVGIDPPHSHHHHSVLSSSFTTTTTSSIHQDEPLRDSIAPRSILKNAASQQSRRYDHHDPKMDDLSPRTLVVGRLEDGMLINYRSPLIQKQPPATNTYQHNDDDQDSNNSMADDRTIDQAVQAYFDERLTSRSLDSLIISDSSVEGDLDGSHSEMMMMISACSILSDTIPTILDTNTTNNNNSFDTTTQITATHMVAGTGTNNNYSNSNNMEFIQQLRGAAFRRKMNLTRSRDSFLNKEKQQREHNAAVQLQRELLERNQQEQEDEQKRIRSQQQLLKKQQLQLPPFKALPLPKTSQSHNHHHGGLVGVPKVEKRPPTIPISPHLGLRRRDDGTFKRVNDDKPTTKAAKATNEVFKALPLPKSSLPVGGAGQSGIPKVSKRMVTIPKSPLLGIRRPPIVSAPHTTMAAPRRVVESKFNPPFESVHPTTTTTTTTSIHRMMASAIQPYIPYSTRRAMQRAEFEQRRLHNEERRMELERHRQRQLVRRLQGELEQLRIEI